jgi:hypothetical protein
VSDLRDLIDFDDLDPEEELRLLRTHDLLLQAGPPAELPPGLVRPGATPTADVVPFPVKRRPLVALLIAAAIAAAAFGGGYLFGHSKAKPAGFSAAHVVDMHPVNGATGQLAVLKVASPDSVGNWPMEMTVRGLPKHGKPLALCGTFRVHGDTTTVRFSVSYQVRKYDGWVVTAQVPGHAEPGKVVLTT